MPGNPQTKSQTLNSYFDDETLARLNEIAKKQDRPQSEIIKEAVNGYLNHMAWFESEVQKGLDDLDAGRVVSHEEVKESIRKLGYHVD